MKLQNGRHLSFPFRIGNDGKMKTVSTLDEHVHDELIQIILTNQGERPFLVDFGAGVRRLVFEPVDETAGAIAKATITQAIERWLGHRLVLESLNVAVEDSKILVDIKYRLAGTGDSRMLRFQHSGT